MLNKLENFSFGERESANSKNYGLAHLLFDEKSSFVIRDLLWVCCGVIRFDQIKKKNRMKLHNVRKIPTLKNFSSDHLSKNILQFSDILAQHVLDYTDFYKLSTHIKHLSKISNNS